MWSFHDRTCQVICFTCCLCVVFSFVFADDTELHASLSAALPRGVCGSSTQQPFKCIQKLLLFLLSRDKVHGRHCLSEPQGGELWASNSPLCSFFDWWWFNIYVNSLASLMLSFRSLSLKLRATPSLKASGLQTHKLGECPFMSGHACLRKSVISY